MGPRQVGAIAILVLACFGVLLLKLRSELRRGGPGGGDPEGLER